METAISFDTAKVKGEYDYLAPDGSEIRLLLSTNGGGICHCTLPSGKISAAVKHVTVEEIWYFLSGEGEMWRRNDNQEEVTRVHPGICLSIPVATSFQFRNTGSSPLTFIISTMPPWPGSSEAVGVEGYWG